MKGDTSLAGGKTVRKILLRLLVAVLFTALLALVAASLILAKPQEEKAETAVATPSPDASPAVSVDLEKDLALIYTDFPAPVMSFMSGSGMAFVSATSSDAAVSGGFGRVATLFWQTPEGEPVTLMSIWPANALGLLEGGYHFSQIAGPTLFGSPSARMENDISVRIHAATDKALYVVLLPRSLSEQAASICRSLQQFTVEPPEEEEPKG